jgi:hypothetical protein
MILRPSWLALGLTLAGGPARAEFTSVHNAHPLGWTHQSPVGETPGWTNRAWLNLEINQANVWNKEADFVNLDTGRTQTVEADFEQSSAIVDFGFALSPRWALSFEVPYANRNGGFMDATIDQFHLLIGSTRFLRNRFGEFGNHFILEDGGEDRVSVPRAEGVGSVRVKLKRWLWEWRGGGPGACECGFAVSTQVKIPLGPANQGLSSGHVDGSVLAHLGAPIGRASGVWLTAGYSRLGDNQTWAGWPRRRDQRLLELSADFAVYNTFGLVLQVRTESPLMNVNALRFEALSTDSVMVKYERLSTAWNALTYWRSTEAFGVRWRWGRGQQINLLATEDFGTGNRDELGNAFYSNNAPDFALVSQFHLVF